MKTHNKRSKKLMSAFYAIVFLNLSMMGQTVQWAISTSANGSNVKDIITDTAGNTYSTGDFTGTVNFGPSSFTSLGSSDSYVCKRDPAGTVLWAVRIAAGPQEDRARGMTMDASGNLYVVGDFGGTSSFGSTSMTSFGGRDIFVVKVDAFGFVSWAKRNGSTSDEYGNDIVLLSNGTDLYFTGYFNTLTNFGTGVINSLGASDLYVARITTNGIFAGFTRYGSTGSDYGNAIATDTSDNIYLTGDIGAAAVFGAYTLTPSGTDAFITKITPPNTIEWAYKYGGSGQDHGNDLTLDAGGSVYATGSFEGSAAFGSLSLSSVSAADIFIMKTDAAGIPQWARAAGGTGDDAGTKIAINTATDIAVSGTIRNSSAFGSTTVGTSGLLDIFVAKLSPAGIFRWAIGGGGAGNDFGYAIAVSSSDVYAAGTYNSAGSFGSFNLNTTSGTGSEAYTLKINLCTPTTKTVTVTSCSNYVLNAETYTTSGIYTQTLVNSQGCDSLLTLNLTINQPTSSGMTQSACGSYTLNSQTYATSGIYTQTLINSKGCDSLLTLNLTINQPTSSGMTQSACGSYTLNSQTYTISGVYTQTLINSQGCDSLLTLNLTINQPTSSGMTQSACGSYTLNSQTYTTSGVYTQTLINSKGCDSLLTLNLTVNQPSSGSITESACDTYTLNSQVYNASGIYTQTLENAMGCDSVITLNLTIASIDNTVTQNGLILTANEAGATYQWLDCDNSNQPISGATAQSFTATVNGNYAVAVTSGPCNIISACTNVSTVGLAENSDSPIFRVYPNPSGGLITISSPLSLNRQFLKIYDIAGQLIINTEMKEKNNQIDLSGYSNGIYILELENDGALTRIRLIKN